jgi:hypothetical protein
MLLLMGRWKCSEAFEEGRVDGECDGRGRGLRDRVSMCRRERCIRMVGSVVVSYGAFA